jgi:hypothetical protein
LLSEQGWCFFDGCVVLGASGAVTQQQQQQQQQQQSTRVVYGMAAAFMCQIHVGENSAQVVVVHTCCTSQLGTACYEKA